MLTGSIISADFGGEKIVGLALGVDENANLAVETENRKRVVLTSGEASLIRKI